MQKADDVMTIILLVALTIYALWQAHYWLLVGLVALGGLFWLIDQFK